MTIHITVPTWAIALLAISFLLVAILVTVVVFMVCMLRHQAKRSVDGDPYETFTDFFRSKFNASTSQRSVDTNLTSMPSTPSTHDNTKHPAPCHVAYRKQSNNYQVPLPSNEPPVVVSVANPATGGVPVQHYNIPPQSHCHAPAERSDDVDYIDRVTREEAALADQTPRQHNEVSGSVVTGSDFSRKDDYIDSVSENRL